MTDKYSTLLYNLKEVTKESKSMVAALDYKNIANCKVLSKRILNHDIEGIEAKIK